MRTATVCLFLLLGLACSTNTEATTGEPVIDGDWEEIMPARNMPAGTRCWKWTRTSIPFPQTNIGGPTCQFPALVLPE